MLFHFLATTPLCLQYQQQLAEINAEHSLLLVSQEAHGLLLVYSTPACGISTHVHANVPGNGSFASAFRTPRRPLRVRVVCQRASGSLTEGKGGATVRAGVWRSGAG